MAAFPENQANWYAKVSATLEAKKLKAIAEKPFHELGYTLRRRVLMEEQNGACNRCGLTHWQGELIPLEMEHKNGNHHDDRRENVELLCHNCHALSDFWRGRNKNDGRKRVTDAQILEAIEKKGNIRQALISLGMASKGNNYNRVKKLLQTKESC